VCLTGRCLLWGEMGKVSTLAAFLFLERRSAGRTLAATINSANELGVLRAGRELLVWGIGVFLLLDTGSTTG
jgi:hypothetical protein